MGYTRHLTSGEIVAQAVHVAQALRHGPTLPARPAALVAPPRSSTVTAESSSTNAEPTRLPAAPAASTNLPPAFPISASEASPRSAARKPARRIVGALPPSDADPDLGYTTGLAPAGRLRNVVLMGMGEPLHNYGAVMHAVDILRDPNGLALGAERITLSTVGVVPGILRLAQEKRPLHLAVSLHAATQEERQAIVPAAKKWPLDELMAACRVYSETTGRRIFYEWTLIEGRNDSAENARAVGRLLRDLPAQVNLIPLNPTAGYEGAPSRTEAAKRFQKILADEFGLPSTVRQRRGIDIGAGCGQLATAAS
jgi:adenine C2-methylase RlmN of 23S rRNA A2503 and tRNA A37